jgi:TolB-like protein/Flp pilus assembly protein TadD
MSLKEAPRSPRSRRGELTLAVLPFLDLRIEDREIPLAENIAEELIQGLSRVEGLRVLSRTTAFHWAGAGLSLAEVGQRLHAKAVLGGTLLTRGSLLALKAEVIDTASGRVLWSGAFECRSDELFETLREVTSGVASALRVSPPAPRRARNVDAHECYLRGRNDYYRFNRHGMNQAARWFHRALDLDPGHASAWAGLATCAAYSYIYLQRTTEEREHADAYSRKALELDPDLAEAHAARGVALSAEGLLEEAEAAFETALRLDPDLYEAAYFYARHCFAAGKPERAIEYFEWAAALRPEDYQAILLVAQAYHSLGVEDEAEQARRKGLALAEQRLEFAPDDARARYMGANALVALGERDKGLAWARMARELDPDDPMLLYNLGCIHALAGNPDEALECLRRAVTGGLSQVDWLRYDSDLDSLRTHPGFQQLMATLEN